jgi:hypothetical protein
MRLSDAILLGSTAVEPAFGFECKSKSPPRGCALGMGLYAVGRFGDWSDRVFPWLKRPLPQEKSLCRCCRREYSYGRSIAHIFDWHVHIDKTWTLEQLCDWVRSVEPEEAPEQAEVAANPRSSSARQLWRGHGYCGCCGLRG